VKRALILLRRVPATDSLRLMSVKENWAFYQRSWRRHPVLLSLWTACILGIAILGLIDLVHGVPHRVWGGVYLGLFTAWFVLWVMLIRRDEPPEQR
jgi:hypothetical protein